MKRKFTVFIIVMLVCSLCSNSMVFAQDGETITKKTPKVLMVGNSLTYYPPNRTIRDLKKLASRSGRKIIIKYLVSNNEKIKNWANPKNRNGKKLYAEIKKRKWDYKVIQEQTEASSTKSFINASKKLAAYIHKKSPNSQIIYNCTWACKKGGRVSGKFYSFSKMQKKMNQNYSTAAKQTGGCVCWSGKAFLEYRKGKGKKKELYSRDNNHASKYGWYLNACCLYSAIFQKSPEESSYYGGFNKKLAKTFQRIAARQNGVLK